MLFFAHARLFRHRQEQRDVAQPAPVVSGGIAIRPSVRGTVTGVNKTTIDDGHDMIGANAGLTLQVLYSDLGDAMQPFILDSLDIRFVCPVICKLDDPVRVYVAPIGH